MRPALIARHRILHVQKHWAHIRHTRACSFVVENTGLSINLSYPVFSQACGAMRYTFKRSVRDGEIELVEFKGITLEVSQGESGREPNAVRSLTLNFGHLATLSAPYATAYITTVTSPSNGFRLVIAPSIPLLM